jgi:BTB/POZ domain
MPPAVAAIPRAGNVHELAADRLLCAPSLDEGSWALFRNGPGGNAPLGEELAVAVVQRSFVHDAELHVLDWCCFLLDAAVDAAEPSSTAGGVGDDLGAGLQAALLHPGDAGWGVTLAVRSSGGDQGLCADRARWAIKLARALLTRVVFASDGPSQRPGKDAGAVQRAVGDRLGSLLRALTRVFAQPKALGGVFTTQVAPPTRGPGDALSTASAAQVVAQDKRLAAAVRAVHAALALHGHCQQGALSKGAVPHWDAGPLVAHLWALVPCAPQQQCETEQTSALVSADSPVVAQPTVTRVMQTLLLYHPSAAEVLCRDPGALAKLAAWVSPQQKSQNAQEKVQGLGWDPQSNILPSLRAEVVDLLCSLFKIAPPDCLRAMQAAHLGAAAASAAADGQCSLITRVAALVAVGALRERPEFEAGDWWPSSVDEPVRTCALALLDAFQDPAQRAEVLGHFHSSPGGRTARAAALTATVASQDGPATVCAAIRLCLATTPERLAAAPRTERRALLSVPGLSASLLHLATHSGESDPLLGRLGTVLLTHIAACQALEGDAFLMAGLCATSRSVSRLAPTVTLRLLPEDPACEGPHSGWPVDVPANRELLAATCPFFKAMFTGNEGGHLEATAAVVTLRGVDPVGCVAVLDYLATGSMRVPANLDDTLAVLGVAERFMVSALQEECTRLVKSLVTPSNIGSLLRFTDAAGREDLCAWACSWAVSGGHATSLVRSGCLAGLPGGAAHALMMAIATRADCNSLAVGVEAAPQQHGGAGVKRKHEE